MADAAASHVAIRRFSLECWGTSEYWCRSNDLHQTQTTFGNRKLLSEPTNKVGVRGSQETAVTVGLCLPSNKFLPPGLHFSEIAGK